MANFYWQHFSPFFTWLSCQELGRDSRFSPRLTFSFFSISLISIDTNQLIICSVAKNFYEILLLKESPLWALNLKRGYSYNFWQLSIVFCCVWESKSVTQGVHCLGVQIYNLGSIGPPKLPLYETLVRTPGDIDILPVYGWPYSCIFFSSME